MINKELVEARRDGAQNEPGARQAEPEGLQKRAEELNLIIHNLKVQLATYADLFVDATPAVEAEVRDTIESLVAE